MKSSYTEKGNHLILKKDITVTFLKILSLSLGHSFTFLSILLAHAKMQEK